MHTCEPSPFLASRAPALREAIAALAPRYDYISVLGTDSSGLAFNASPKERRVSDSSWNERGFVFRVQKGGRIVEYALNDLPQAGLDRIVAEAIDGLIAAGAGQRSYGRLPDEPARASRFWNVTEDPFAAEPEAVLGRLEAARAAVMAVSPEIVFSSAQATFVAVRKIFVSPNRFLEQSQLWCQAFLVAVAKRGEVTRQSFDSLSGLRGLEVLDGLPSLAAPCGEGAIELLGAGRVVPGEYDVIADPEVAGIIAHEAFGHGVEMDMFVKGRALAPEFMGRPVASPIVTMYDGAEGQEQVGSFLFDDEGTFGTKTKIIDNGILVAGISDMQSALHQGTRPTGNGRRQAFDHKAYARMTNTYFSPGSSTLDEMIASIKRGYLLQKSSSGMEDPKNWGIQLMLDVGREIVDGKLTGRVVTPVVCSGYVPDVLRSISMLSAEIELEGAGACGKGHKEFAKVSCGGPYVKTRMRLG